MGDTGALEEGIGRGIKRAAAFDVIILKVPNSLQRGITEAAADLRSRSSLFGLS